MLLGSLRLAGNRAIVQLLAGHTGSGTGGRLAVQRIPPANLKRAEEDFTVATALHRNQSKVLLDWLEEGSKSNDVRLKNACEWVKSGYSRLYAVTPTGDSAERVARANLDSATMTSFFPEVQDYSEGGHVQDPDGGQYNWKDIDDNAHVRIKNKATNGWNAPGRPGAIALAYIPASGGGLKTFMSGVVGMTNTKQKVFGVLKHEVQHTADRHDLKLAALDSLTGVLSDWNDAFVRVWTKVAAGQLDPGGADAADLEFIARRHEGLSEALARLSKEFEKGTPPKKTNEDYVKHVAPAIAWYGKAGSTISASMDLERYKTEYRAYSYEGKFDSYDPSKPVNHSKFGSGWTARQLAIFEHVYEEYPHTSTNWDSNSSVLGPHETFRKAVLAYRDPDSEGVNKPDSVRVDRFYELLLAVPLKSSDEGLDPVQALIKQVQQLTAGEAAWIRNSQTAPRDLTNELERRLKDSALSSVLAELDKRSG